ncbi:TPA: hypothetical protein ACLESW_004769 [Pseudomonas aeruginosa]|uniref:hypothetical protein n=1 Tax=Pseudomonas aeruginosa TaxID=287 RepID=UPI00053E1720|nr:hypothetical protein [Pseudomonas aeruginosa]ELH0226400.1 hypothetical protein [Pseudomonas aeruginosa]MBH4115565.1 hypothetical protein [Pseudomonas aeruginosa]MBI8951971.1 hypothetical protein [Pseudomonas aeruginosa]MCS8013017.1 hypothetical protein [Pseudomonas aeruginosa]MCT1206195.1 hypothetical protein [Pseudomonas aeruginosa]
MKELKKQRDALISERDTLDASIPGLRAAWEAAPNNWDRHGNCIGSPERTAAMNKLSAAEGRLRSIPGAIERIDREISYQERLADAKQARAKARQVMSDSASTVAALSSTRGLVHERLQSIQKETELAIERAQQAELDAANLYARSVATGNSEGEKAASNEMQKASAMLIQADEHARRQELIIAALQAEIDVLDTQITTAQQQQSQAQDNALAAAELTLGEEWNRLAEQLAAVGAKILAADRYRGGGSMLLSGLSIPSFGPSSRELCCNDVLAVAEGITLADLIEA